MLVLVTESKGLERKLWEGDRCFKLDSDVLRLEQASKTTSQNTIELMTTFRGQTLKTTYEIVKRL